MDFYTKYLDLCNKRGKSPSKVALENKISKASVTRWKYGYTPTDTNINKLAIYFGVSVDYLKENEAEPTTKNITSSDIKFALWGGDAETISDEMLEDVKRYAQFIKEQNKKTAEAVDEDK